MAVSFRFHHAPLRAVLGICLIVFFSACSGNDEISLDEYNARTAAGLDELLAKTLSRPWKGQPMVPGKIGGTWNAVMTEDPKSFNHLSAEEDSATAAIVNATTDYLVDYDMAAREWIPRIAFFELRVDESAGKLDVIYTLRENLYWSYYGTDRRIPVTSDDVVFWYNEISGDARMGSSAYYQQFVVMEDGSEGHVDIEKLDERRFVFHFPRIVADPLLATNMDFGPRHIYEPLKRNARGEQEAVGAVRSVFGVDSDPRTIPSMGRFFIVEYTQGQRVVFARNPDFWERDSNDVSIPYYEREIVRIIPDANTQKLLFLNGETESYLLRPEDVDEMINREQNDYTVFNAEGSLAAAFWTFNQNPRWKDGPKYSWFTKKEFRQAMSCLLNRDRIIAQAYRGLAETKLAFFPGPNRFYNPSITNEYTYDLKRARELLRKAGFRVEKNVLKDDKGNPVEFDLTIRSESTVYSDIASIIADELSKAGIKLTIRVVDFQKQVEAMFTSFEWDSMLMGLSGSNIWPSQGSNVWPSSGNLHMWFPNQESPATEWEARIDYLYNEGCYTADDEKAKPIWDEYQRILLDELPVIHLFRSRSFLAVNNRWDFTNLYFDNESGIKADFIFAR
ncbi:MAG: ABC transporter substrate-binding protein [Treponema sp.]|jgi:peptide/nickel transport system substrate-binding protein|nr:ABC transporter substrate-binding protein [Treponema sp.]